MALYVFRLYRDCTRAGKSLNVPDAKKSLAKIIKNTDQRLFTGSGGKFDFSTVPYSEVRKYCFQSAWLSREWYDMARLVFDLTKPDGLTTLDNFTLFAYPVSGETYKDEQGQWHIKLDKYAYVLMDGYDFDNDQPLGVWDPRRGTEGFSRLPETWIVTNETFREYREQTGFGGDFRTCSRSPAIDSKLDFIVPD